METCELCSIDHMPGSPECPVARLGRVVAGKYRLMRILGVGGMGAVYEAHHLTLNKVVALKMLHARYGTDENLAARFQSEAQKSAALNHPAIVRVLDFGRDHDGCPYLEMELLVGSPVAALVEGLGPVPVSQVVSIATNTLDGLAVAHSHGIVHRDLKPQNLFISNDPQLGAVVKILDFGIAKAVGDDSQTGLTATGTAIGTVSYMSPEQLSDAKRVDARTDIFAMGATLYELLVGHPPVHQLGLPEAVAKILAGTFPRNPAALRTDTPPWLDEIVATALASDPDARFQTVQEMQAALRQGKGSQPDIPVTQPVAGVNAADEDFRLSYLAMTAAGESVPGADSLGSAGDTPAPVPMPAPQKPRRWLLLAAIVGVAAFGLVAGGALVTAWALRGNRTPTRTPPAPPVIAQPAETPPPTGGDDCPEGQLRAGVECRPVPGSDHPEAEACRQGQLEACDRAGNALRNGHGTRRNDEESVAFERVACAGGLFDSCVDLGWMLSEGRGAPRDAQRAAQLFERACERESAMGCFRLGRAFLDGQGVEANAERAATLFERACAGGAALSCNNLAYMAEHGRGMPAQSERAAQLYRQACDGGEGLGCQNLARLHEVGRGAPRDAARSSELMRQAMELLEGACETRDAWQCAILGDIHAQGRGVPENAEAGANWHRRACHGGDGRGCTSLAYMYQEGRGVERELGQAAQLYRQGCDGGDAAGCRLLGVMYRDGLGVTADLASAARLYGQACAQGDSGGCNNLGTLHAQGRGMPENPAEALQHFRQACELGSAIGCRNAANLLSQGRGVPRDAAEAATLEERARLLERT